MADASSRDLPSAGDEDSLSNGAEKFEEPDVLVLVVGATGVLDANSEVGAVLCETGLERGEERTPLPFAGTKRLLDAAAEAAAVFPTLESATRGGSSWSDIMSVSLEVECPASAEPSALANPLENPVPNVEGVLSLSLVPTFFPELGLVQAEPSVNAEESEPKSLLSGAFFDSDPNADSVLFGFAKLEAVPCLKMLGLDF